MSESTTKEYTSLRVEKDALDAVRESKLDKETWTEFIQRCAENPPEIVEVVAPEAVGLGEVNVDALRALLGGTESVEIDGEAIHKAVSDALDERPSASAEVDVDELAAALSKKMGSDLEMAAYRGSKDALEQSR